MLNILQEDEVDNNQSSVEAPVLQYVASLLNESKQELVETKDQLHFKWPGYGKNNATEIDTFYRHNESANQIGLQRKHHKKLYNITHTVHTKKKLYNITHTVDRERTLHNRTHTVGKEIKLPNKTHTVGKNVKLSNETHTDVMVWAALAQNEEIKDQFDFDSPGRFRNISKITPEIKETTMIKDQLDFDWPGRIRYVKKTTQEAEETTMINDQLDFDWPGRFRYVKKTTREAEETTMISRLHLPEEKSNVTHVSREKITSSTEEALTTEQKKVSRTTKYKEHNTENAEGIEENQLLPEPTGQENGEATLEVSSPSRDKEDHMPKSEASQVHQVIPKPTPEEYEEINLEVSKSSKSKEITTEEYEEVYSEASRSSKSEEEYMAKSEIIKAHQTPSEPISEEYEEINFEMSKSSKGRETTSAEYEEKKVEASKSSKNKEITPAEYEEVYSEVSRSSKSEEEYMAKSETIKEHQILSEPTSEEYEEVNLEMSKSSKGRETTSEEYEEVILEISKSSKGRETTSEEYEEVNLEVDKSSKGSETTPEEYEVVNSQGGEEKITKSETSKAHTQSTLEEYEEVNLEITRSSKVKEITVTGSSPEDHEHISEELEFKETEEPESVSHTEEIDNIAIDKTRVGTERLRTSQIYLTTERGRTNGASNGYSSTSEKVGQETQERNELNDLLGEIGAIVQSKLATQISKKITEQMFQTEEYSRQNATLGEWQTAKIKDTEGTVISEISGIGKTSTEAISKEYTAKSEITETEKEGHIAKTSSDEDAIDEILNAINLKVQSQLAVTQYMLETEAVTAAFSSISEASLKSSTLKSSIQEELKHFTDHTNNLSAILTAISEMVDRISVNVHPKVVTESMYTVSSKSTETEEVEETGLVEPNKTGEGLSESEETSSTIKASAEYLTEINKISEILDAISSIIAFEYTHKTARQTTEYSLDTETEGEIVGTEKVDMFGEDTEEYEEITSVTSNLGIVESSTEEYLTETSDQISKISQMLEEINLKFHSEFIKVNNSKIRTQLSEFTENEGAVPTKEMEEEENEERGRTSEFQVSALFEEEMKTGEAEETEILTEFPVGTVRNPALTGPLRKQELTAPSNLEETEEIEETEATEMQFETEEETDEAENESDMGFKESFSSQYSSASEVSELVEQTENILEMNKLLNAISAKVQAKFPTQMTKKYTKTLFETPQREMFASTLTPEEEDRMYLEQRHKETENIALTETGEGAEEYVTQAVAEIETKLSKHEYSTENSEEIGELLNAISAKVQSEVGALNTRKFTRSSSELEEKLDTTESLIETFSEELSNNEMGSTQHFFSEISKTERLKLTESGSKLLFSTGDDVQIADKLTITHMTDDTDLLMFEPTASSVGAKGKSVKTKVTFETDAAAEDITKIDREELSGKNAASRHYTSSLEISELEEDNKFEEHYYEEAISGILERISAKVQLEFNVTKPTTSTEKSVYLTETELTNKWMLSYTPKKASETDEETEFDVTAENLSFASKADLSETQEITPEIEESETVYIPQTTEKWYGGTERTTYTREIKATIKAEDVAKSPITDQYQMSLETHVSKENTALEFTSFPSSESLEIKSVEPYVSAYVTQSEETSRVAGGRKHIVRHTKIMTADHLTITTPQEIESIESKLPQTTGTNGRYSPLTYPKEITESWKDHLNLPKTATNENVSSKKEVLRQSEETENLFTEEFTRIFEDTEMEQLNQAEESTLCEICDITIPLIEEQLAQNEVGIKTAAKYETVPTENPRESSEALKNDKAKTEFTQPYEEKKIIIGKTISNYQELPTDRIGEFSEILEDTELKHFSDKESTLCELCEPEDKEIFTKTTVPHTEREKGSEKTIPKYEGITNYKEYSERMDEKEISVESVLPYEEGERIVGKPVPKYQALPTESSEEFSEMLDDTDLRHFSAKEPTLCELCEPEDQEKFAKITLPHSHIEKVSAETIPKYEFTPTAIPKKFNESLEPSKVTTMVSLPHEFDEVVRGKTTPKYEVLPTKNTEEITEIVEESKISTKVTVGKKVTPKHEIVPSESANEFTEVLEDSDLKGFSVKESTICELCEAEEEETNALSTLFYKEKEQSSKKYNEELEEVKFSTKVIISHTYEETISRKTTPKYEIVPTESANEFTEVLEDSDLKHFSIKESTLCELCELEEEEEEEEAGPTVFYKEKEELDTIPTASSKELSEGLTESETSIRVTSHHYDQTVSEIATPKYEVVPTERKTTTKYYTISTASSRELSEGIAESETSTKVTFQKYEQTVSENATPKYSVVPTEIKTTTKYVTISTGGFNELSEGLTESEKEEATGSTSLYKEKEKIDTIPTASSKQLSEGLAESEISTNEQTVSGNATPKYDVVPTEIKTTTKHVSISTGGFNGLSEGLGESEKEETAVISTSFYKEKGKVDTIPTASSRELSEGVAESEISTKVTSQIYEQTISENATPKYDVVRTEIKTTTKHVSISTGGFNELSEGLGESEKEETAAISTSFYKEKGKVDTIPTASSRELSEEVAESEISTKVTSQKYEQTVSENATPKPTEIKTTTKYVTISTGGFNEFSEGSAESIINTTVTLPYKDDKIGSTVAPEYEESASEFTEVLEDSDLKHFSVKESTLCELCEHEEEEEEAGSTSLYKEKEKIHSIPTSSSKELSEALAKSEISTKVSSHETEQIVSGHSTPKYEILSTESSKELTEILEDSDLKQFPLKESTLCELCKPEEEEEERHSVTTFKPKSTYHSEKSFPITEKSNTVPTPESEENTFPSILTESATETPELEEKKEELDIFKEGTPSTVQTVTTVREENKEITIELEKEEQNVPTEILNEETKIETTVGEKELRFTTELVEESKESTTFATFTTVKFVKPETKKGEFAYTSPLGQKKEGTTSVTVNEQQFKKEEETSVSVNISETESTEFSTELEDEGFIHLYIPSGGGALISSKHYIGTEEASEEENEEEVIYLTKQISSTEEGEGLYIIQENGEKLAAPIENEEQQTEIPKETELPLTEYYGPEIPSEGFDSATSTIEVSEKAHEEEMYEEADKQSFIIILTPPESEQEQGATTQSEKETEFSKLHGTKFQTSESSSSTSNEGVTEFVLASFSAPSETITTSEELLKSTITLSGSSSRKKVEETKEETTIESISLPIPGPSQNFTGTASSATEITSEELYTGSFYVFSTELSETQVSTKGNIEEETLLTENQATIKSIALSVATPLQNFTETISSVSKGPWEKMSKSPEVGISEKSEEEERTKVTTPTEGQATIESLAFSAASQMQNFTETASSEREEQAQEVSESSFYVVLTEVVETAEVSEERAQEVSESSFYVVSTEVVETAEVSEEQAQEVSESSFYLVSTEIVESAEVSTKESEWTKMAVSTEGESASGAIEKISEEVSESTSYVTPTIIAEITKVSTEEKIPTKGAAPMEGGESETTTGGITVEEKETISTNQSSYEIEEGTEFGENTSESYSKKMKTSYPSLKNISSTWTFSTTIMLLLSSVQSTTTSVESATDHIKDYEHTTSSSIYVNLPIFLPNVSSSTEHQISTREPTTSLQEHFIQILSNNVTETLILFLNGPDDESVRKLNGSQWTRRLDNNTGTYKMHKDVGHRVVPLAKTHFPANVSLDKCKKEDFEKSNKCFCAIDSLLTSLRQRVDENVTAHLSCLNFLNAQGGLVIGNESLPHVRTKRSYMFGKHDNPFKREVVDYSKGFFDEEIRIHNTDNRIYGLMGSRIVMPCVNKNEIVEYNRYMKYSWTFDGNIKMADPQMQENEGNLIFRNISAKDSGNYTCTITSILSEKSNLVQNYHHRLTVVALPVYKITTTLIYELKKSCDLGDGDVISLYFPNMLGGLLCGYHEKMCKVEVWRPACIHQEGEKLINVTFAVTMRPLNEIVPHIKIEMCNLKCQVELYSKLATILLKNIDIFTKLQVYTNVTIKEQMLTPKKSTHFKIKKHREHWSIAPILTVICPGGFGVEKKEPRICVVCPKNTFNGGHASYCKTCPPGQYQPMSGSTSCMVCSTPLENIACLRVLYSNTEYFKVYVGVAFATVIFIVVGICLCTRKAAAQANADRLQEYVYSIVRKPVDVEQGVRQPLLGNPNPPNINNRNPPQLPPPDF